MCYEMLTQKRFFMQRMRLKRNRLLNWYRNRLNRYFFLFVAFCFLVIAYECFEIFLINMGLFDSAPKASESSAENIENGIDAVYTWVNGSDPQHMRVLRETTNQLTTRRLQSTCLTASQWTEACLPVVLIRPRLSNADRHFAQVLHFEDFDEKASLIYFQNMQVARTAGSNCIRIIDGKVFKLTNLCIAASGLQRPSLRLSSLVLLNNISAVPGFARDDPLKYISVPTRKQFKLYDTLNNASNVLYMHRQAESNLSRIVSFIRDKVHVSAEFNFQLEWPLLAQTTDEHFFEHELHNENIRPNRFADNEELRYSLRSVERFAPWIRHVVIVTNGQIPHWLNMEHPKLRIVQHKEIFTNLSHLPNFNSAAIESHLHRIPGLSKQFLYFNDDIILADHIYPDDFYTQSRGFKVYLSWAVPNCAEGCPLNWLNDGYCDKACNSSRCLWDGGDCLVGTLASNNDTSVAATHASSVETLKETSRQCAPNCLDNWLGDSFCDQACNKLECAYDMADCGIQNLPSDAQIQLDAESNIYEYAVNSNLVYLNMSTFIGANEERGRVKFSSAQYENVTCVRTAVLNQNYNLLTVLFLPNTTRQSLNITLYASINQRAFNFTVYLIENGTSLAENGLSLEIKLNLTDLIRQIEMEALQAASPTPIIESASLIKLETKTLSCETEIDSWPANVRTKLQLIEKQQKQGLLTENGKDVFIRRLQQLYVNLICGDMRTRLESPEGRLLAQYLTLNSSREGEPYKSRRLLDAYADSLIFVNHLYNKAFGVQARQVPAHMAHFVDVQVMKRLQQKFSKYFEHTSASQVRSSEDMQFSFAYFYFLMSETVEGDVEQILHKFDTDHSNTMSLNELRTFIIQLNGPHQNSPDEQQYQQFYAHLNECCHECFPFTNATTEELLFSQEFDIQITMLLDCPKIREKILTKWGTEKRNKFETLNDENVAFKMLRSNESLLQQELDELRSKRKKFICLNDNFEHNTNRTLEERLKRILQHFYTSLLPTSSRFELEQKYYNKYLYIEPYNQWKKEWTHKRRIYFICSYLFLTTSIILFFALLI